MNALKHTIQQPFISATGLAAFVHSTWALATLFGGDAPEMRLSLQFAYWLIPAMLIAFALDVGQIATSIQIRNGQRNLAKYVTFAVFAIANYFLQWLYMAHHMPELALGDGVRQQWQDMTQLIRDASLWVIPSFLPLATLLYTVSESDPPHNTPRLVEVAPVAELPAKAPLENEFTGILEESDDSFLATCDTCDWHGTYESEYQAKQARNAHMRSHKLEPAFSPNGNGHHH